MSYLPNYYKDKSTQQILEPDEIFEPKLCILPHLYLIWAELSPFQTLYVKVLTLKTSECECIQIQNL